MKSVVRAIRTALGWLGPRRRGRWILAGLDSNVEVLSDDHGVPHVFAHSQRDLFFVQGYLHARERAFQMDLQRRIGQGRLSEVLGGAALPADIFLRKLGLWQQALRLWPELDREVQSWMIHYAHGVNVGLKRLAPVECWLLGHSIEPWTALHSLLWTLVMAFDMGSNWESEWVRWKLLEKLGPDGARRFHLEHPEEFPSGCGSACGRAMDSLWSDYQRARGVLDQWMSWVGGSNAWAVSPRLSATGQAMLASDPHVLAKVPSTWYEVHLECPDLCLYGASLPGMPGIVIGHNTKVGWGITNSYVDTQDLVWERIEADQVLRPQGLTAMVRREEVIRVKGRPDHLEVVWETPDGPLLFDDRQGTGISMRWAGWNVRDSTVRAWRNLLHCQSVQEAQQTLQGWQNPCLNFVLADSQGNIGYQLTGRVPIRRHSHGVLPQAGWQESGEWVGWVDPQDLPSSFNPECGYVVSANQAPRPLQDMPYLGVDFCDGYRAQRIAQQLAPGGLTQAAFARLQTDTISLAARVFVDLLRRDCGADFARPDLLAELLNWDGDLAAGSRPAAVYQVLLLELTRQAYEPVLGKDLFLFWCGAPVSTLGVLGGHAGRYVSFVLRAWELQELPSAESPTWPQLLAQAWSESLKQLERLLGAEPAAWRWGALHGFQPGHPLAIVPWLSALLNPPRIELGGDVTTVLQSTVLPQEPFVVKGWVPSYRLVVELGANLSCGSVLPTGQSGWVGDPMQFDQQRLWAMGRLHSGMVDRQELELSRPERLVLLARSRVSQSRV